MRPRFPTCRRVLLVLLASLPLLAGCASPPAVSPSPAFDSLSTSEVIKRRLTFTPEGTAEPRTLIALLRLEPGRLRAALLTPYGQRLVTLVSEPTGSHYVAGDVPEATLREHLPVPAEWLAARLQWSLWPVSALRQAFADSEWSVELAENARVIRHRGDVVAWITPADAQAGRSDTILLDDRQGGYRLRISPLEDATP